MSLGRIRRDWLLTSLLAAVLAALAVFAIRPWVRGGPAVALSAGLAIAASTGIGHRWSDGRWGFARASAAGAVAGCGAWLGHYLAQN